MLYIYSILRNGDKYVTSDTFRADSDEEAMKEMYSRFLCYPDKATLEKYRNNKLDTSVDTIIAEMKKSKDQVSFVFNCNTERYIFKN